MYHGVAIIKHIYISDILEWGMLGVSTDKVAYILLVAFSTCTIACCYLWFCLRLYVFNVFVIKAHSYIAAVYYTCSQ